MASRGLLSPVALGLVFAGGALGTLARYGVSLVLPGAGWPWATFAVNIVGAFLLGFLLELLSVRRPDDPERREVRWFFGPGFLGGFTTYSTLAFEAASRTDLGTALLYGAASLVLGVLAALAGIRVAASMRRRRPDEAR
jgi:CrcB protein